ncbi:hypothetical protein DXB18_09520 [Clostridium sp. OM02-18AC]|nr:hypothetical protein DXB18_09520 [Clostridium sp. OM02-18AC]
MLKKTTNKDYTISSKTLLNTLISIPDKTAIEISKIDISKIQKTLKIIQKKKIIILPEISRCVCFSLLLVQKEGNYVI